jgi:aminoglycoside 2''-phosphotransferase
MEVDVAQNVLRVCFPALEVRDVRRVERGWDHYVFEVDGRWIFRFPRWPTTEDELAKELRLLPELVGRFLLAIPEYRYVWNGDLTYRHRFAGYPKIPGSALDEVPVQEPERFRFPSTLGQFLTELHAFPPSRAQAIDLPGARDPAANWRRRYETLAKRARQDVLRRLDSVTRREVTERLDRFLPDAGRFPPTLVHMDLDAEHVLLDPGTRELTGVIDWGAAGIGDPAIDFAGFADDPGWLERMLAAYTGPRGPHFEERIDFYFRIAPLYGLLNGIDENSPKIIAANLERLRRRMLR